MNKERVRPVGEGWFGFAFLRWVMTAAAAWRSAKRKTNQNKQTNQQQENGINPTNLNEIVFLELDEMKENNPWIGWDWWSGTPRRAAPPRQAPFISSSFHSPAVRDWNGRERWNGKGYGAASGSSLRQKNQSIQSNKTILFDDWWFVGCVQFTFIIMKRQINLSFHLFSSLSLWNGMEEREEESRSLHWRVSLFKLRDYGLCVKWPAPNPFFLFHSTLACFL